MPLIALQGIVLFLFIPLVLFLYLRQPLGPVLSIVVGVVIMFGHRFVAAPWMARHATERCLWCGRLMAQGSARGNDADVAQCVGGATQGDAARGFSPASVTFPVFSGGRRQTVAACSWRHRDDAGRFLTFVARYRAPIAIGILVPLFVLLVGTLTFAAGRPLLAQEWSTWQFKTIVAFTVVVTSFAYRTVVRPVEPLRSPFPLHNLFLLGIRNTLWVFRLVGAWWLVAGIIRLTAL
jgi:hypothetical protein